MEKQHVDAFMRDLQSALAKIKALRFRLLSVRLGMAGARVASNEAELKEESAAEIVEFYIPANFRKNNKWIPQRSRGRVIEFIPQTTKSADSAHPSSLTEVRGTWTNATHPIFLQATELKESM